MVNKFAEDTINDPELKDLQDIADKRKVAILAFIAPYTSKRISPISEKRAAIGIDEEFVVETAIKEIKAKLPKKNPVLYLLINSPGGTVSSSYQIARELRRNFGHIVVFVLHRAASGGTLMAMAGNEIVMGDMARLSPIDVQVEYNGQRVSANSMETAIAKLEDYFKDKLPEEAPYPWQLLAQKIDPIFRADWGSTMASMRRYAWEILVRSGYSDKLIKRIITNFVFTIYDHDFVIPRWVAKGYGLNIVSEQKYNDVLQKMRPWLKKYMLALEGVHVIRYILPKGVSRPKKNPKSAKSIVTGKQ